MTEPQVEIQRNNYQSNVSPWPSLYKAISNYALFPNESYAFYGFNIVNLWFDFITVPVQ